MKTLSYLLTLGMLSFAPFALAADTKDCCSKPGSTCCKDKAACKKCCDEDKSCCADKDACKKCCDSK